MRIVKLYTKDGCGLCREARDVIDAVRARVPFELVETDITSTDELLRDYGVRIPVVEVDGVEEFEISVDPSRLERLVFDQG